MRGFVFGLLLLVIVVLSVLTMRPGGLRYQIRNVGRRLKLAILLGGIFMVVSGVLRLALPNSVMGDVGLGLVGLVLGVVFLILSQDRPVEGKRL